MTKVININLLVSDLIWYLMVKLVLNKNPFAGRPTDCFKDLREFFKINLNKIHLLSSNILPNPCEVSNDYKFR